MQTMTIKELAGVAGCNEKTVRRIGKNLFPALFKKGVKVEFDNAQAVQLMKAIPKKNMVGQMSEDTGTNVRGVEDIAKIVSMAVLETLKAMGQIPQEKPALPELPPVNYRLELNALVRAYASKNDIIYPLAWSKFYERCLYRLRVNIPVCAVNAGMDKLDWAEENGLIEKMYQLAKAEL